MKIASKDLFTPANALTLLGLGLCSYGAWQLNSLLGISLLAIGRMLDIADGVVARRTHTSAFGALLDASTDKFITLLVLIASWHYRAVPVAILAFILIQNIVTVCEYFYVSKLDIPPAPSTAGKRAVFAQGIVFVSFALEHLGIWGNVFSILGWTVFVLHLPIALQTSIGYTKVTLTERAKRKANTTTKLG